MLRTGVRRFLEGAVLVLLASLAVVVVVGVGFRKAGAALVWYDEVASILLAWLTYYGAALAALRRAHIGVPTLAKRLHGRARSPSSSWPRSRSSPSSPPSPGPGGRSCACSRGRRS